MKNISCWMGHLYEMNATHTDYNRKGTNIFCKKCGDNKMTYPKADPKRIMDMMKGDGIPDVTPSPHGNVFSGYSSVATTPYIGGNIGSQTAVAGGSSTYYTGLTGSNTASAYTNTNIPVEAAD